MQDDLGAAVGLAVGLNLVLAFAIRFPSDCRRIAALREHRDLVGHDERRIEAHAELTDQLRVLGGISAQCLQESLRAGARNGAQIVDHFGLAHPDAVVLDRKRTGRHIREQPDRQSVGAQQIGFRKRFEAQLLAGVRGVGDQFAQEDFLVRIQGVNHQSQYLLGFGLELFYLRLCFGRHGLTICVDPSIEMGPPRGSSRYYG